MFLAATVLATAGHARRNDDPNMRHVRLTLTDGKQVEGYIPKKKMNWGSMQYTVVLSNKPDGKKGEKYKAEKLEKMEWLTPTEEHPEGEVWERCQTIYRYMIRPVKADCLLELLFRGQNASVYKAHIYLVGNGVNTKGTWVTWYALKPNGQERAFLLYNVSLGSMPGMKLFMETQFKDKEEYDGLKEYIRAWWEKDKKLARKQVGDSPAIFSTLYDEWKAGSGE